MGGEFRHGLSRLAVYVWFVCGFYNKTLKVDVDFLILGSLFRFVQYCDLHFGRVLF